MLFPIVYGLILLTVLPIACVSLHTCSVEVVTSTVMLI